MRSLFCLDEYFKLADKPSIRSNIFKQVVVPILRKKGFKPTVQYSKHNYEGGRYSYLFGRFRKGVLEYIYVNISSWRRTYEFYIDAVKISSYDESIDDIILYPSRYEPLLVSDLSKLSRKFGVKGEHWTKADFKYNLFFTAIGQYFQFKRVGNNLKVLAESIDDIFDQWYALREPCNVNKMGYIATKVNELCNDNIINIMCYKHPFMVDKRIHMIRLGQIVQYLSAILSFKDTFIIPQMEKLGFIYLSYPAFSHFNILPRCYTMNFCRLKCDGIQVVGISLYPYGDITINYGEIIPIPFIDTLNDIPLITRSVYGADFLYNAFNHFVEDATYPHENSNMETCIGYNQLNRMTLKFMSFLHCVDTICYREMSPKNDREIRKKRPWYKGYNIQEIIDASTKFLSDFINKIVFLMEDYRDSGRTRRWNWKADELELYKEVGIKKENFAEGRGE